MSVPSSIASFIAQSNGVDAIVLTSGIAAATPALIGYRYFESTVSQAAATALAQDDIDAGGLNTPPGLLTDVDSFTSGSKVYSRSPLPAPIVFVRVEALGGERYFAAVAWNADGASPIAIADTNHIAPVVPEATSIVADEAGVTVTFDQSVSSPTGELARGWAFFLNGVALTVAVVTHPTPQSLRYTFAPAVIREGQLVRVTYSSVSGNLENANDSAAKVATLDELATNESPIATLLAAVLPFDPAVTNVLTLIFSSEVTAVDLLLGATATKNGDALPIVSIAAAADPRYLLVTFAGGFRYDDVVVFLYADGLGGWESNGTAIPTFTITPVNAAKGGTPSAAYPLSTIIQEAVTMKAQTATAAVVMDLNAVDSRLVEQYQAAFVEFGGTFGITLDNPVGITIPARPIALSPGLRVVQAFYFQSHPEYAAEAADDWRQTVTQRIGLKLAELRVLDPTVVLNDVIYTQV